MLKTIFLPLMLVHAVLVIWYHENLARRICGSDTCIPDYILALHAWYDRRDHLIYQCLKLTNPGLKR